MRKPALLSACAIATALAACGGAQEPEVVEQIVVREPGQQIATQAATGDADADPVAAGKAAFLMCTGCHVAEAGEASAAGPNLYNVVGRAAGTLNDFAYSDAMVKSGITWDAEQLDRFLANPSAAVPGTAMAAGAVDDEDRRAAIIAYLENLSE